MKKLLAVAALAAFTFGIAQQETPKKGDHKGKKECKVKGKKANATKVAQTV